MSESNSTGFFKEKLIGRIPEEWKTGKTLNELYMKGRIGWQGLKKDEFLEEGHYLVTGIHFNNKNRVDWEKCFRISDYRYKQAPEIQLKLNDILITKDGTIGKVAYIDYLPGTASLNSHLLVLRPINNNIYQPFLYYQLLSSRFRNFIENIKTGSTLAGLTQTNFGKFELILPPLSEQRAIAAVLTIIDEAIEATEKIIAKRRRVKDGLMQDLFRYGLDNQWQLRSVSTHRFKDSPLGRIPEEWEVVELGKSKIEIIDGDRGENYPSQNELYSDGYCLFLNANNVTSRGFKFENAQFIDKKKDEKLRKGKCQRKDLILTTRGTVGNLAYYSEEIEFNHIRINSGMVILRNSEPQIHNLFFYQIFSNYLLPIQYSKLKTGSAQPQLPIRDLRKFLIVKPTFSEQSRIAAVLSAADEAIEKEEAVLEKLKAQKRGLMEDLLTGKVRVTPEMMEEYAK